MGQYQQWLHYREMDQQLQAQVEALEVELAFLQERLCLLSEAEQLPIDNEIIQALLTSSHEPTVSLPKSVPVHTIPSSQTSTMTPFFDSLAPTEPQIEIPWWLRDSVQPSETSPNSGPVDPVSVRTNLLIQHWFERWGRQPSQEQMPLEDQS